MNDKNNSTFFLAVALSVVILMAWQILYLQPKMERERVQREQTEEALKGNKVPGVAAPADGAAPSVADAAPGAKPGIATGAEALQLTREAALKATPRVAIDTPSLSGSISLKGGRIDDVTMKRYREHAEPSSPNVVLFSPSGSPFAYYAEHGWVAADGKSAIGKDTVWKQVGSGSLGPSRPVTLEADGGNGLVFKRTIAVDADYLFTVKDEVENRGGSAVTLYPYAIIYRHGVPHSITNWLLHEGIIGFLGEAKSVVELDYSEANDAKVRTFKDKSGWLGITDKYWAAALIPPQTSSFEANVAASYNGTAQVVQTDYLLEAISITPGSKQTVESHLFAGAKNVPLIDAYGDQLKLPSFDMMLDWGWFYWITKPLFYLLDWLYQIVGNFGLAILGVTVIVKGVFFPLANKSYESMSRMKKLQPQMQEIQARFKDDKMKQQQEVMRLYKEHKVNPLSGCLPMLLQIPVFFALYKVLFVTIEMRHAPFYGWIKDLVGARSDLAVQPVRPHSLDTPAMLMIGIWPLIMGVTMWLQMKLNPAPADPVQAKIFGWMPLIFTFTLAPFAAGLVIYWSWNNLLSILQQSIIMKKNGVKVEIFDNLKKDFGWLIERFGRGKKA